jgi:DNA-binding NarL/FixJ family response regulator
MARAPLRVLIADDDPFFLSAFEVALAAWDGIEVVALARDGAEAVRLFSDTRPDVAIVDLSMPRGSGIEVTAQIRKLDSTAVVLILSGTEAVDSLTRCLDIGARGCLRKGDGVATLALASLAAAGALQPQARPLLW